jgi:hypothetical protein
MVVRPQLKTQISSLKNNNSNIYCRKRLIRVQKIITTSPISKKMFNAKKHPFSNLETSDGSDSLKTNKDSSLQTNHLGLPP